ncbi:zinc finger containing protein [Cordyceps fumosorosea ARSEF 2679]|uniref:Zinc finger containing protein n=1 Tax=Cordyceps fumosorosea (strain ARSEF 2679) TaxID=1081104 RepID=A0A167MJE1_CORFA|nr:zinc finger containing protein [Cordyceps fumosorosea ARSEF 2679]OAA54426.1 zinc finger containing protein [Cordyceps fumosorosea ARSEF 2679]
MSHSKRNTTRAVFTSYERSLAKANWASNSARLHRDSFLSFGSCSLCLEPARDPVSCPRGDIFCRECALANMLAQKKDMKRADKARRQAERDNAQAQAAHDDEDQRRAIRDFELTQAGLLGAAARPVAKLDEKHETNREDTLRITNGKRKFELDADELERIAKEDRTKARKAIEDEKAAKLSLPSFWTPSLTPDATKDARLLEASKKTKPVAVCPASPSDSPHALTMQSLITIHFDVQPDPSRPETTTRVCPSCRKALTNASSPAMAVKCGHVLCLNCVKQFVKPPSKQPAKGATTDVPAACFVCDTPLAWLADGPASGSTLPSGMIALKSEGTGFSARGGNTVERTNVAFQC